MRRLVAIVGATATGKTALGEAVAEALHGEIVCADARQVFTELEIGTGKPTPAERGSRPHHLFDARVLGEDTSAGWWARRAAEACEGVWARGSTPVLVGGSGLYVDVLRRGLMAEPPKDAAVRARLRAELAERGVEAMHARLAAVDPEIAARLMVRDQQRIVRALEVWEVSGEPMSRWHARPREGALAGEWRVVEVTCAPALLEPRIAARTRAMFDGGLVEEARELLARGLQVPLGELRAIGYDEAMALLAGEIDRAEAEARTNRRTRQMAKRQRTWFRHQIQAERLDGGALGFDELLRRTLEVSRG